MRDISRISVIVIILSVLLLLPIVMVSCYPKKIQTLDPGVWISIQGGYDADFSPDGNYLVFTDSMVGRNWKEELYLYTIQTGDRKVLTKNSFWDGEARWSPDGTTIVFTTDMMGLKNISFFPLPDGPPHEIISGGAYHPSWSPSGKQLVFVSARSRYPEWSMYSMRCLLFSSSISARPYSANPQRHVGHSHYCSFWRLSFPPSDSKPSSSWASCACGWFFSDD